MLTGSSEYRISRSNVTAGAPCKTPAVIPTTMNSTSCRARTSMTSNDLVGAGMVHQPCEGCRRFVQRRESFERCEREHPVDLREVHSGGVEGCIVEPFEVLFCRRLGSRHATNRIAQGGAEREPINSSCGSRHQRLRMRECGRPTSMDRSPSQ